MRFLFCCILTCFFSAIHSQNLQLIDTVDFKKHEALKTYYETKNEKFESEIKAKYSGKLRREVQSLYSLYQNEFYNFIDTKKILFLDNFQKHIDSLHGILKDHNDILQERDLKLLLSKDPTPNAFSVGDGTIVANIGLFSLLQNEQQIAAVLSHEIAHELLEHTSKGIENRAKINITVLSNNSNFSRQLKTEKFNKGAKSFELLKSLLYDTSEKRRQNEVDADSLGYLLFKNSKFEKSEYLNALKNLKKYDSVPEIVLDSTIYAKIFNLPEQPFNPDWIKLEDFGQYNYEHYTEKIDSDSIKDHPEIEDRILRLLETYSELDENSPESQSPSKSYAELQQIANKAFIENLFYIKEHGWSLFLILKRLEANNEDAYLKYWLATNFYALHDAKKQYQLNRYVDRIAPKEQSQSFQQFLSFVWNLNLREMQAIADYYSKH